MARLMRLLRGVFSSQEVASSEERYSRSEKAYFGSVLAGVLGLIAATALSLSGEETKAAIAVLAAAWGFFFFFLGERVMSAEAAHQLWNKIDILHKGEDQHIEKVDLDVIGVGENVNRVGAGVTKLGDDIRNQIGVNEIKPDDLVGYVIDLLPNAHAVRNTFVSATDRDRRYPKNDEASRLREAIVSFVGRHDTHWDEILSKGNEEKEIMEEKFKQKSMSNGRSFNYFCYMLKHDDVPVINFTIIDGVGWQEVIFGGKYLRGARVTLMFRSRDSLLIRAFEDYFEILKNTCDRA